MRLALRKEKAAMAETPATAPEKPRLVEDETLPEAVRNTLYEKGEKAITAERDANRQDPARNMPCNPTTAS